MIISVVLFMVKISSLNCNGARNNEIRRLILELCDADIVCLQETHWDEEVMREVEREWMGEMYVNNGGAKSRGVAILVKRGLVENATKCVDDGDGRVIGITFEHLDKRWRLLNVYAPNEKERRVFFLGIGRNGVERTVWWWETLMCGVGGWMRSDVDRFSM